jgi:hypothetical protein
VLVDAYDYRNCQSLFGYAAEVHERSGGVCQLCGCGADRPDFDLWRQLTVEHLVGRAQGGYLDQIKAGLSARFPEMSPPDRNELARRIDAANTVTACGFCNSTTSQDKAAISMAEAIASAPDGSAEKIFEAITCALPAILQQKRTKVQWKLASVREAYDRLVAPRLRRCDGGAF